MTEKFATYDVLGVPISVVNVESAAFEIAGWKHDRRARSVGVREVASIMAMRQTPELLAISHRTTMNLPDGMPLVWIGKLFGLPVSRTCGPDLFEKVMLESPRTGLKHFLFGGKEGVAEKVADVFRARAPGIEIVGTYCPPFRQMTESEDAAVVEMILQSGADIVWVGMSSPKQDIWMDTHLDRLPLCMIGVGAAFDFHSGAVRRAPQWMQKAGLEWLHRLITEPRRLWRRYLVMAPKFIWLMIFDLIRPVTKIYPKRKEPRK